MSNNLQTLFDELKNFTPQMSHPLADDELEALKQFLTYIAVYSSADFDLFLDVVYHGSIYTGLKWASSLACISRINEEELFSLVSAYAAVISSNPLNKEQYQKKLDEMRQAGDFPALNTDIFADLAVFYSQLNGVGKQLFRKRIQEKDQTLLIESVVLKVVANVIAKFKEDYPPYAVYRVDAINLAFQLLDEAKANDAATQPSVDLLGISGSYGKQYTLTMEGPDQYILSCRDEDTVDVKNAATGSRTFITAILTMLDVCCLHETTVDTLAACLD